jgi:hypothetical protein
MLHFCPLNGWFLLFSDALALGTFISVVPLPQFGGTESSRVQAVSGGFRAAPLPVFVEGPIVACESSNCPVAAVNDRDCQGIGRCF